MRRMLQRIHKIKDLSFLEGIDLEPIFSGSNREEVEEEEEVKQEIQQGEPFRWYPLK